MEYINRHVFEINENGKAIAGTIVTYPANYSVEGNEQVTENMGRAFYLNGEWVIYDPLVISVNASEILEGDTVEATATLPEDSLDSTLVFNVRHNGEDLIEGIEAPVVDGTASQTFEFEVSGSYSITVTSKHHGVGNVGVTVHEQPDQDYSD